MQNDIHVKTEQFDGPLALLLLLIQKQEMNIRDLNIGEITRQYIELIVHMQEINFDLAGDYLLMAATLLFLKSRYCVEGNEEKALEGLEISEEEISIKSKEELVRRLLDLYKFQKLSDLLWQLPRRDEEIFCRHKVNRKEIRDSVLTPLDISNLTQSMLSFLRREGRKTVVMLKETASIKEKLEVLKRYLHAGERAEFYDLIKAPEIVDPAEKKVHTILTFISLLELARLKKVTLYQNESVGNIYIDVKEDLQDFNTTLADGFEALAESENSMAVLQ